MGRKEFQGKIKFAGQEIEYHAINDYILRGREADKAIESLKVGDRISFRATLRLVASVSRFRQW